MARDEIDDNNSKDAYLTEPPLASFRVKYLPRWRDLEKHSGPFPLDF